MERRLREAYQVFQLVQSVESPHTVRVWLIGLNRMSTKESTAAAKVKMAATRRISSRELVKLPRSTPTSAPCWLRGTRWNSWVTSPFLRAEVIAPARARRGVLAASDVTEVPSRLLNSLGPAQRAPEGILGQSEG